MFIERTIEFELRWLTPNKWLFSWQCKNLGGKSFSGLIFTAKVLHEAMYLTYHYLYQITYIIEPQKQDFKSVWDLSCK